MLNSHLSSVFTKDNTSYIPTLDIGVEHLKILETFEVPMENLTKKT